MKGAGDCQLRPSRRLHGVEGIVVVHGSYRILMATCATQGSKLDVCTFYSPHGGHCAEVLELVRDLAGGAPD